MMDAGLVELLRCPRTGQALTLDRDASSLSALNEQVADGRLGLASGELLDRPLEAVLRSADQTTRYPVAAGIAYLLAESALVVPTGATQSTGTVSDAEIQRQQMAKYSEIYEDWTGGEDGVARAIQKVLHGRYGQLLAGATVLDVGNGGTPAQAQYGAEIAQTLKHFIAADKSSHMLRRSGPFGDLVLADAFGLPFKDAAVDFVTVNNTIHHFGRRRGQAPLEKMRSFFDEALRVAQRGVVGVELLVPAAGEVAEKLLL
ncbi:MAG: class I SAM-dependent methyltransferase, partial [Stenotrophobium sp.]